jgi:Xaa-Pro aminopeptidase
MKADLHRLMQARGLDGLVVECTDHFSAPRAYLTGGVSITQGKIVLKTGGEPILIVNPMEIEEAAKSGLRVVSYLDLGWAELFKAAQGDRDQVAVEFWARCLRAAGIDAGTVGVYGVGEFNRLLTVMEKLRAAHPQYGFVGESGLTIFDEASLTKDADEVARLRDIGARVAEVWAAVWDFLSGHRAQDGRLVGADDALLTIGAVKRFVRRALLDRDLEDTDMIFAQGRDGGFPHSRGEADAPVLVGEPIVFDLFPRELGGGYHHDSTRTWCIDHAPDAVHEVYEQVMEAFDLAIELIRPGVKTTVVQSAVQDYFEAHGHATTRSDPNATNGYVHSLGHGIGLNIHERPSFSHLVEDKLSVGNVFTIEPGLYYPERGFGVRVEDTFYLDTQGELHSLTPFRKDLILPLRG